MTMSSDINYKANTNMRRNENNNHWLAIPICYISH